MTKRSTTVGLDVHKESIDMVVAEPGAQGEVRHFGTISGDLRAVDRMVKQLRARRRRLQFVYEAGPVRIPSLPSPAGAEIGVHGGIAVDDAEAKRGSDQDPTVATPRRWPDCTARESCGESTSRDPTTKHFEIWCVPVRKICGLVSDRKRAPVVAALQALRGVDGDGGDAGGRDWRHHPRGKLRAGRRLASE